HLDLPSVPTRRSSDLASEDRLAARAALLDLRIADLLLLDDAAFRALFAGTPVKRLGSARFLRNVLIAAGNSGDLSVMDRIEALLDRKSTRLNSSHVEI